MRPLYSFILLVFGAIVITFGCKKDDNNNKPGKPYTGPFMQAKSAAIYPDGGVTLTGTFLKVPDSLKTFGFLVASDSLMRTNLLFIKASSTAALGDFTVDVNAGLVKGLKYYYTPFYSTSVQNVFGTYSPFFTFNIKSFNSDGSKSVKVDSLYPMKADIGDTITIKGKYFMNQGLNVVTGGQYGYISVNDTIIKFIVPQNITTITPTIVLQYTGHLDTLGKGFTLNTPVIGSFTATATFRDTITVTGDHFGYANTLNEVDFGTVKGTIISSSRKQLKVVVPDGVTTLNSALTIKAQLQTVMSPTPFRIRRPVITSVTPSPAMTSDVITVTGKYFHPVTGYDVLYFEGINTPPNSGTATQIQATLPQGPFPRRKAAVALKFLDTVITWSQDITLKDKWVWVSATIPFAASSAVGSFTINNVSYVVAPIQVGFSPQVNYLWKFNPADLSWQQINIPFNFSNGIMTSSATKAYLYTTGITDNFWEYDPSSNTWTEKANYAPGTRYAGVMFAIGSEIYLGLGQDAAFAGGTNPPDNTLYQFDIASNTWTQKANYPVSNSIIAVGNATAMVFGTKAVVFGSANVQNYNSVFSYNQASDTWTPLTDFNSNNNGKNAFVYNGYGFVAGMDSYSFPASDYRGCFKYNSATDTWSQLPDDIGQVAGLGTLQPGFTFINNGIVYVGGTDGPYSQLYSTSVSGL
jgi:IPT/TIG domain